MTQTTFSFAREFRKNKTAAENYLWHYLQDHPIPGAKFYRQQALGHDRVDFVNFEKKVIIAVEGGQPTDPETKLIEAGKAEWLHGERYEVIPFSNHQVLANIEGVMDLVKQRLERSAAQTAPLSREERMQAPESSDQQYFIFNAERAKRGDRHLALSMFAGRG
jgi:very-short-patch-repair endonuclease